MTIRQVLIIDDEDDIRTIIQGCLEEIAGWQVLTASSGQAGINLAARCQPDGILLDVSMPGMDGLATWAALQTTPETQDIPVLLLTAKALPDDQDHFAHLGVAGVILKPFDPMTLVEQITQIFGWEA